MHFLKESGRLKHMDLKVVNNQTNDKNWMQIQPVEQEYSRTQQKWCTFYGSEVKYLQNTQCYSW